MMIGATNMATPRIGFENPKIEPCQEPILGPQETTIDMLQFGTCSGSMRVLMRSVMSSNDANQPITPAMTEKMANPNGRAGEVVVPMSTILGCQINSL